jgi:sulfide dehydrogenase cytochrome subunit
MKRTARAVSTAAVAAALWGAATLAGAHDATALRARSLVATCAACHGTDGRAAPAAAVPGLTAMPPPYLVEQMKAFKSGARAGTVMPQLAKGYSDAQIEQLAEGLAKAGAAKP